MASPSPATSTGQPPTDRVATAAAAPTAFVHLHLHTEYSLLDGANRIDDLVERVKQLGMNAVAVTDHGNLHGAMAFYHAARSAGIKPILGIEAYVAPGCRTDRTYTGIADGGFHLVLLAENNTGWRNLLRLSSDAFLNGFYYKPRMDKSTLAAHADGLIAINGHLGSSIAHHLTRYVRTNEQSHYAAALEEARWHAETFKSDSHGNPRFYIELQRHVDEQEAINPHLIRIARELNLPLVCDNDSHFLTADDHDAHDSLICISTGKLKEEPNRLHYPPDLYVKSPAEMYDLFAEYADGAGLEALRNTVAITDRCHVTLDSKTSHAPVVKIVMKEGATDHGHTGILPVTRQGGTAAPGCVPCASSPDLPTLDPASVSPHPVGSTAWYTDFCARFELQPFDSHRDTSSAEQLKRHCDSALRQLAEAGAVWRYGPDGITPDIRARLDRELRILADKSISAYFLIVWDFVNYARSRGIPANARGSGVGTMVGYCLGLSNACPVHYGLLFERFTDPDRSEYPDIDIDICQDGRAEVIDYVRRKYGHVAQIITFGTLKARAVIRDVGRVMNIPLPEVDRIAKLIPGDLGMTLDKALDAEPDLKKEYDSNPQTRRLIDTGRRLEGMARHASVHAAGVVVATQPLDHIVPLYRDPKSEDVITQWDGPTVEKAGLLKMDFLGLRTLSIIERAKSLIRSTLDREAQVKAVSRGHGGRSSASANQQSAISNQQLPDPLDLDRLTFDDQAVLELFRRGETAGIFQFESGGMRSLLIGMRPDRLEDLIAANALFRPGPMDLIPVYTDRKHQRQPVPSFHEIVDRFTAETYGVMVYQEQVMQILHTLGSIPLREAYSIIKAISKKKESTIAAAREKFIEGAAGKGMGKERATELFELILKFAGYGFNKSHSTGYAIIAYQTAYLKTYFPLHYMAALLTYESVSTEKVTEYIEACRRTRLPNGKTGIEVRPPDINLSLHDFTVVYGEGEAREPSAGHIRFGLGAVKGVGEKAVEAIIEARRQGPFTSLFDFTERVPHTLVNKAVIEALIKCGAFDSVHGAERRAALVAAAEQAMKRGAQHAELTTADDFLFGATAASDSAAGKGGMGGAGGGAGKKDEPALPDVTPWDPTTTLKNEKQVLGFYVSSHPLDRHRAALGRFTSATIGQARECRAETMVTLGGMVTKIRHTVTRARQEKMAIVVLEDLTGSMEAVAFPRTFAEYSHLLTAERIVVMEGKVDRGREEPNLLIERVIPLEEAAERLTREVHIHIRSVDGETGRAREYNGSLSQLRTMLRQSAGPTPVVLHVHTEGEVVTLEPRGTRVKADGGLPERVNALLRDPEACELAGPVKVAVEAGGAGSEGDLAGVGSGEGPEGGGVYGGEGGSGGGMAPRSRTWRSRAGVGEGEVCESVDRY